MHNPLPHAGGDDLFLSQISPKDKPWDKHRAEADAVRDLYKNSDFSRYADRIEQCSQLLQFALRCEDQGELMFKLHAAKFCRVRHCPVCQWRRSMKWRARFFQVVPKLQEAHPAARYIFLTLTVKNCPVDELKDRLMWMNKSWEKLTKRKQFPAIGFVKSVEVTRASDGQAHPHFHVLLMVPSTYFKGDRYINQAKWAELWKSCLKVNYTPVVNVKAVKAKAADGSDLKDQMAKALCETLKYSVKPNDLVADPEWLHKLTEQLHKTRAVSVGGIFKEYLSEDEPEDDSSFIHLGLEENKTSKDDPMVFFGWREMLQKYMKK